MGEQKAKIGGFEELVLLAVQRLGDKAYGVPIRQALDEAVGKSVAIGAVYATLERLEEKGFVRSRLGDPTPERGGRAKRFYRIEGSGLRALAEAEEARSQLRRGALPRLQPEGGAA